MCSKGTPSTTTQNNQVSNQSQNSATQGQQLQTGFAQVGPNPATGALYQQFLNGAKGTSQTPFDLTTLQAISPWTAMQEQAANNLWTTGQAGMQYVPQAAALIGQAGQSTIGQIPGVAASMLSPWAGQAVDYGMSQGNQISNYARNLAAQGPQLQQFSQGAIDQYMSPYINDVVNATQNQFTNANTQQGNVLLGQGIRQGNAFGGDRAGIAQAQLANQQQLAQAPVIAGLYNTGYGSALGEFNTQNALAAQLGQAAIQGQIAGGQLGMQGLNIGNQASTAANQQAIAALGQNQQAQLQAGNMFGQLGALQYSQNLAGAQQAMQGASAQPAWLQGLMNASSQNQSTMAAYPYNQSNWYGNLLQGMGPLTGTQQQNVNGALSNYLQNVQGTAITNSNGTTTPPQPNQFLQLAGLGIAGLGLLANRGGSVPYRRGGAVPRMAAGGAPYGGHGYIQMPSMQPTHMPVPNTSATDIKLPNLSLLTFPSGATNGAGSAASGSNGSASTLGQISSLLGNKQVQTGLKSIGSNIFGGGDTAASSTSVGAPDTTVSVNEGLRRGGMVNGRRFRRGGYADGGYAVENYDDYGDAPQRTGATWFDTSPSGYAGQGGKWSDPSGAREGPPASGARNEEPGIATPNRNTLGDFFQVQAPDGSWKITRQTDLGPGNEPRSRGIGLDVNAALADEMGYTPGNFPSGKAMNYRHLGAGPGLPEQMNTGLPDRRDAEAQSDIPTSGLGATAQSNRQPGGQQGGYRSFPIPGAEPRPQGILQRWASNPLTQFGLGLASAPGAGLTGVVQGLNAGVGNVMAQRMAEDKLDRNYKIDTSGQRMRIILPNQVIETPFETAHADTARQRAAAQKQAKTQKMRNPETGEDELVQINPDGTYTKLKETGQQEGGKATAQSSAGGEDLHGKAYLDAYIAGGGKADHAKLIEQIGNYDIDPTKVESLFRGNRKRLMEEVLRYNPDYSTPWYSAGAKSLQEFLTGGNASPAGQSIAANTAVAHAGTMSDALEDLKSIPGFMSEVGKSGLPFASYAAEYLKNKANLGTPTGVALNRYLTASRLYASEVSRMYVGGVGAEADRAHMESPLNPNLSYKELTGAIHQSAKMLKGRTDSLDERREAAMSAPGLLKYSTKAVEVVDPETGQVTKRLPLTDIPVLKKRAQEEFKKINDRYGAVTADDKKTATPAAPQINPERRQQAIDWAKSNPDDPRAKKILERVQ